MKKNYRIYPVLFLLLLKNLLIISQEADYVLINGEIVNTAFTPVQFANIISQKTSKGTFSDNDGKFNFKAHKSDTLIFIAISFRIKKMAVSQLSANHSFIILDSMVYSIATVNIRDIRWKEFEYSIMNSELKPMDRKILVIKGLPNPYTELFQIKPNLVMNPISAIYEFFTAENIRKRKQGRWNNTYNKTWIKIDDSRDIKH